MSLPAPFTQEEREALYASASKYCREQLAIMDGSAEAGIKRIGTTRFEKMVNDVMKMLARAKGRKL